MSEQILIALKSKIEELVEYGAIDAETKRNILKEELQYYVLNFIFHHPKHSKWIMYGGTALRICHGLDRMSVDLDFEIDHAVTHEFLKEFKDEINKYFSTSYGVGIDFLTIKLVTGRGLLLKFYIDAELGAAYASKQIHVKIDLNHFTTSNATIERRPINHNQLSFVIVTYNMSTLMASKIAAIFLRGIRGVGKAIYEEKGRDIYDLLWYMNKKVVPNIGYLVAKHIKINDLKNLFDKLTIQMNKVNDTNLKQDLMPLFVNQTYIENWLKNWRESYLQLLDGYGINTVTILESIEVYQDFNTDVFSFIYRYKNEHGRPVQIIYNISDYWIHDYGGDFPIEIDAKLNNKIQFMNKKWNNKSKLHDKLKSYVSLFNKKTEKYLNKTNRIMLGDAIITKIIRSTADNLNQKEQTVLNKSALLSCELNDLLK